MTTHKVETNSVDQRELLTKFPEQKVEPLWTVMHSMVKPKPAPRAEVCLWKYKELRPLLLQAGETVSSEEAERRVLMLVNPTLGKIPSPPKFGLQALTPFRQALPLRQILCMPGCSSSTPVRQRRHTVIKLSHCVSSSKATAAIPQLMERRSLWKQGT